MKFRIEFKTLGALKTAVAVATFGQDLSEKQAKALRSIAKQWVTPDDRVMIEIDTRENTAIALRIPT